MDWERHHAATGHAHGHGGGSREAAATAELAGFLAGCPEPPRSALDLGCGTGADAAFLARQGIAVTGIDASETALAQARERAARDGVHVAWILSDALHVPIDDACMDLALDHGLLHHVDAGDRGRYVAEVARVLRPGGTLLIRERNHAGHHGHAISEAEIRAMVAGSQLRVRTVVADGVAASMLVVLERA